MPTIEASIEAALFARAATLDLEPTPPIAWSNVDFEKPAGAYLRITHIPNSNRRLFLKGSDPHQRMGLLQIDAFTPKNKGSSAATEMAGKIAEHFAADLYLRSGSIAVRITKAPDIGPAFADDTHWQVPVTIHYETYA